MTVRHILLIKCGIKCASCRNFLAFQLQRINEPLTSYRLTAETYKTLWHWGKRRTVFNFVNEEAKLDSNLGLNKLAFILYLDILQAYSVHWLVQEKLLVRYGDDTFGVITKLAPGCKFDCKVQLRLFYGENVFFILHLTWTQTAQNHLRNYQLCYNSFFKNL